MSEVVSLKKVEPDVNETAVDILEKLLADARAGEIVALAVVFALKANTVGTACAPGTAYHLINSGAATLSAKIALSGEI